MLHTSYPVFMQFKVARSIAMIHFLVSGCFSITISFICPANHATTSGKKHFVIEKKSLFDNFLKKYNTCSSYKSIDPHHSHWINNLQFHLVVLSTQLHVRTNEIKVSMLDFWCF